MHLVHALQCGIRGAEKGTAHFYVRGTETDAAVYADKSGAARYASSDVELDDYGSVNAYVDELVDVVVINYFGASVRSFTSGSAASSVEVVSESFTGTDYSTGVVDENEPVLLDVLLGLWKESTGETDFRVSVGTQSLNISDAVSVLYGTSVNVSSDRYGAVGDGANDDYGAIQNAINDVFAAGGGVVFFPAGDFFVSSTLVMKNGVSLTGSGASVSTLTSSTDAPVLSAYGDSGGQRIRGLRFASAVENEGPLVVCNAAMAVVEECAFDGENVTGNLLDIDDEGVRIVIERCEFFLDGNGRAIHSFVGSAAKSRIDVDMCYFVTPVSYTGSVVGISAVHMECCTFNVSDTTSGTLICYQTDGEAYGSVDCTELRSVSVGPTVVYFDTANLNSNREFLFEDCFMADNAGVAFYMYSVSNTGFGYYCRMKSVEARHSPLTTNATVGQADLVHYIVPDAQQYGVYSVLNSDNTAGAGASSVCFGADTSSEFESVAPWGAKRDVLYAMKFAEPFTGSSRTRNSVLPDWKSIAASVFAFRLMQSRAYSQSPSLGMLMRWYCIGHGGGQPTVDTAYRESYAF